MNIHKYRIGLKAFSIFVMAVLNILVLFCFVVQAGNPHGATYCSDNDKLFWFLQISDIHMGTRGSQDSQNLQWIVNEAKNIINPTFIVASGDLTDSTDGNILGWPNGPYQAEWDEYKSILNSAGVTPSFYYDIPGNHDAYNDQYFEYYLANSIQGQATGKTQISWTRTFSYGKYHFIGVNTADNSGDPFSLSWPWGDYAGLDPNELSFIYSELEQNQDAELTLIFGHHPVTDTGYSDDTWLYYGQESFVNYLDSYGASLYGYGHTHRFEENIFTGNDYTGYMAGDGVYYFNIASIGKSSENQYSIIAVDCNGISTVTENVNNWPAVLITAPLDKYVGTVVPPVVNPYAYSVPNSSTNPIRALVFDSNTVTLVQYRIDEAGQWNAMTQVVDNPHLWEGVWDASALSGGNHTIEVQATSNSGTRTDFITVEVEGCSTDSDCDDGLYCNGVENCIDNICQDGTPVDCNDNINCTDDSCNEINDVCDNIPNDANCDDGIYCNGLETCDSSNDCLPGTPVTCTDDLLFCNGDEICDEGIDSCISTGNPCLEGSSCNEDSNMCEPSTCPNGTCDEGEDCSSCPKDCISGSGGGTCDACFKGKCDGICNPKKETSACSDCVQSWCCGDGICEGGEDNSNCEIDCGAPVLCGDGTCDPGEDQCNCPDDCGDPLASEDGFCTDGLDNDCDELIDSNDPDCECLPKGETCTTNDECCSNWCHRGACK